MPPALVWYTSHSRTILHPPWPTKGLFYSSTRRAFAIKRVCRRAGVPCRVQKLSRGRAIRRYYRALQKQIIPNEGKP